MYWSKVSAVSMRSNRCRQGVTYHPEGPEGAVVYQEPCLFGKASEISLLRNTPVLRQGPQDLFHEEGAQSHEQQDAEGDEVGVVPADSVQVGGRVVVGEGEEFLGVWTGFW